MPPISRKDIVINYHSILRFVKKDKMVDKMVEVIFVCQGASAKQSAVFLQPADKIVSLTEYPLDHGRALNQIQYARPATVPFDGCARH